MKKMRIFGLVVLVLMLLTTIGLAAEKSDKELPAHWIAIAQQSEKTIYLDESNFESNRKTDDLESPYRITFWIRHQTLEPENYLDYQMIVEVDRKSSVVRYKTLQSRHVGDKGMLSSKSYVGWQRLLPEEPETELFRAVWEYDQKK